ncbi:MAG: hypothetical protein AAFU67_11900, partial [Bacteroidota bacterium]
MLKLNVGEYTGEVVNRIHVESSIITNTLYSERKNNPAWHCHENLHICFVFQKGKAETKRRATYTDERAGSIFFYYAGQVHRWISPSPVSKSANIEIGHDFLQKYALSEADVECSIHENVAAKSIILKMQREMQLSDQESRMSIQSLLLELANYSKGQASKVVPQWFTRLDELLQDNWNEPVSLAEMATAIGVHPVTISKFFRKHFS